MTTYYRDVRDAFSRDALVRICTMAERNFPNRFGLDKVRVNQAPPAHWYAFRDNNSRVLAVAHLDTVVSPKKRNTRFIGTGRGELVLSGALDDRLGAYIILDLLPRLGVQYDILLTTGEEMGMSTASYFESDKQYDWIIEFDRGGTDMVMYQFEDDKMTERVESVGMNVGIGSFSDIAYLSHLGAKAMNWGVGYQDYHSPRGHAYLDDMFWTVSRFLQFHELFYGIPMPHDASMERHARHWWDSDDWSFGDRDSGKSESACAMCDVKGRIEPLSNVCLACDSCLDCFMPMRLCLCHYPQSSLSQVHGFNED